MTAFLIFLWFFFFGTPADAAPLIAAAVAAVGISGIAATVVTTVLSIAVSFGVSFLANKLFGQTPGAVAGGAQMDIRVDADVPQSLIVGRATTAGSLVTAETYGAGGSTQNSDMIEIIAIADHPCQGLVGLFIDSQIKDLQADDGNRGQTVDGYNNGLAVKFYDGSQVAADAFAVLALSTNPERPWTSNHVGRGRTYIRTHSIYNSDLVPGRMNWRFVVDGIRLYDPRKDTTVGGSGSHLFDDLDTHEWTENLAVIAYNVLRGIRVKDGSGNVVHFYGLENTPAENLPLEVWFAAMNECDVIVDGEPQYYGGGEVTVDTEPMEFLRSILASTGGRLVEIGGIYKLYLGAPTLSVYDFTDDDLLAAKSDSFKPYLGLEQRINYITGQYMSPDDGWIEKVAPVRSMPAWEVEDGRRKQADLQAPLVQSAAHMQRIMQQMLFRSRQQRKHTVPLSRMAFHVEPGDIVSWTSARNGYVGKLFEVDAVEYESNLDVNLSITEVDPTDYDWEGAYDFLPEADTSITQTRPAPKIVAGFSVEAYIHTGNGSTKPAIKLTWDPPTDGDVDGILYQIRRPGLPDDVVNGSSDEPESGALIILAGLASLTDYEVRARFRSFNGYATDWSLWIPVTTPDARVTQAELDASLSALISRVNDRLPLDLFSIKSQLDALSSAVNAQVSTILESVGRLNIGVGQRFGENQASAELALTTAIDAQSAIAGLFVDLTALTPDTIAQGLIRFVAAALPEGAVASFSIELRATVDDVFASTGFYMDVGVFEGGATSRIRMVSDAIYFEDGEGLVLPALTFRAGGPAQDTPIVGGIIQADLGKQRLAYKTTLTTDALLKCPTGGDSGYSFTHIIKQDGVGGRTLEIDTENFIGNQPDIDTTALATTVLQVTLVDIATGEWTAYVQGSGVAGITYEFIDRYTSSGDSTSYSFPGVLLGDESADRLLVMSVSLVSKSISGLTVNGVAATRLIPAGAANDAPDVTVFTYLIPTGATCDIVVTTSATSNDCAVDVGTLKNYVSSTPTDTDYNKSDNSTRASVDVVVDIPAGGIALFVGSAYTPATALSLSSAFIYANDAIEGKYRIHGSRKPATAIMGHAETMSVSPSAKSSLGVVVFQ